MIQLALSVQRLDWEVLEQELLATPGRTLHLMALHNIEGWGEERADLRAAHNTAMAHNLAHGGDLKAIHVGTGLKIDEPTIDQIRERDAWTLGQRGG